MISLHSSMSPFQNDADTPVMPAHTSCRGIPDQHPMMVGPARNKWRAGYSNALEHH